MNIYQKLVEVRKVVTFLKKDSQGQQYKYTSSSQVLSSVREKMDELGLLLTPAITDKRVSQSAIEYKDDAGDISKRTITYFTELDMTMTWTNAENPDETITIPWYAQGVDIAGEKGVGKALTYGEKYFILKQFNIPTDKDDPDSFQEKSNGNGNSQRSQSNGQTKNLSDKQIKRLYAIASTAGYKAADVKKVIMTDYKKTQAEDLTKQEYDALINRIESSQQQEQPPLN